MKALAYAISMTLVASVALTVTVSPARAADMSACAVPAAAGGDAYPTFCAIPHPPQDVRTPAQFRTAVVAVRSAGQALVRSDAASPSSLAFGDAAGFAAEARAEAAPPPPMIAPGGATADFAREAKEAATPPPRPH